MVIKMTVYAHWNHLMHLLRMGFRVADPTGDPARVRPPVAIRACKLTVLERGFLQLFPLLPMTGDADPPGRRYLIHDIKGAVYRVTAIAVGNGLPFDMGFVTLETLGNKAMHCVAEGAGLRGMPARILAELASLFLMTGKAGSGYSIGELKPKGIMGVGMAPETVFKGKMGTSLMAPAALRDTLFTRWGMLFVAVNARHR